MNFLRDIFYQQSVTGIAGC